MLLSKNVSSRVVAGLLLAVPLALSSAASAQSVPSAESTLLLTWFEDPTTTMAVQWITPGDVPPRAAGTADISGADHPLPAFDAKQVDDLVFDGDPADWGRRGLRVAHMPQPNGNWPDPTGSASLRSAWTPHGLAVLVTVTDDEVLRASVRRKSRRPRISGDRVEFRLTGADPTGPSLRFAVGVPQDDDDDDNTLVTSQPRKTEPVAPSTGVAVHDGGYVVETLLPWSVLRGFEAVPGARCGLQVEVVDEDDGFEPERLSLAGYTNAAEAKQRTVALVLAGPGRVDAVRARIETRKTQREDGLPGARLLAIGGEPRLIGETVTLRSGKVVLGKIKLERVQGFAGAEWLLKDDFGGAAPTARLDALTLELDGRVVARAAFDAIYWSLAPDPATLQPIANETAPDRLPEAEVVAFGDRSGWFVQRVRLTELKPDTDYAVGVPGRLEPVRFRTAPATLTKPLVFAEGGDVGTSHHVGMLHDEAAQWDPLFGLVGGDCAYGNGRDAGTWLKYLKLWNDHMSPDDGRSVPMLAAIGNHEVDGGWNKHPEDSPFFRALFGPLFSPRGAYATLDFGSGDDRYASFYLLDSGHTIDHGGRQTNWLKKAMAQRRGVPHQFACYHVPAYPSHRPFDSKESAPAREHWVPLFEEQQLDAVFEHHDHTYKRTHALKGGEEVAPGDGGVLYLGDGCWGRPPRSVDSPLRPYLAVAKSERNVMRVALNPDGTQSVLAVNEHGQTLDDITISAGAAVETAQPAP